MTRFKEHVYEEAAKIFTALVTWGLGILLMIAYCTVLYFLGQVNTYIMIAGALLFLTVSFFFIDLWWSYKKMKDIRE